jgi:DNA repair exonuclease SbcCD ATPase subunit
VDQQNLNMVWNIICALFAGATSIIAFFTKKSFSDLDKRIQNIEADSKLFTENIHRLAIQQAKNESIASALSDLKNEVKELRELKAEVRDMKETHMESRADMKELRNDMQDIKIFIKSFQQYNSLAPKKKDNI